MAEVLVKFTDTVQGADGLRYAAQACGGIAPDGLWEGWIEFIGPGATAVRTPRETEQPNRDALVYWAEGLTAAYLEGALRRALDAPVVVPRETIEPSLFSGPARSTIPVQPMRPHSVLDPFATYAQGEGVLRRQLLALSRDHLATMIDAYQLGVVEGAYLTKEELVEQIILAVQRSLSVA